MMLVSQRRRWCAHTAHMQVEKMRREAFDEPERMKAEERSALDEAEHMRQVWCGAARRGACGHVCTVKHEQRNADSSTRAGRG